MKTTATGKDVRPGDQVQLESGEWVTVTRIRESMHPGDTMLVEWTGKSGSGSGRLFADERGAKQKMIYR